MARTSDRSLHLHQTLTERDNNKGRVTPLSFGPSNDLLETFRWNQAYVSQISQDPGSSSITTALVKLVNNAGLESTPASDTLSVSTRSTHPDIPYMPASPFSRISASLLLGLLIILLCGVLQDVSGKLSCPSSDAVLILNAHASSCEQSTGHIEADISPSERRNSSDTQIDTLSSRSSSQGNKKINPRAQPLTSIGCPPTFALYTQYGP